jgi:hypothetical protein
VISWFLTQNLLLSNGEATLCRYDAVVINHKDGRKEVFTLIKADPKASPDRPQITIKVGLCTLNQVDP